MKEYKTSRKVQNYYFRTFLVLFGSLFLITWAAGLFEYEKMSTIVKGAPPSVSIALLSVVGVTILLAPISFYACTATIAVSENAVIIMKRGEVFKTYPFEEYRFESKVTRSGVPFTEKHDTYGILAVSRFKGKRNCHYFCWWFTKEDFNEMFAEITGREWAYYEFIR
ncbi:MAG: hypothetical protein FWF82_01615 [Oscillospiraceae bacterium]|nr:hypothetical protein [Oscillospiraceae bacterium]